DSFRRRMPEYAIFNLDYRLVSGQHLFPTQEQDVRKALEFIAEHASGYGVSTDRVVLLGASAGAHLALLQAYKYTEPVKVRAVIDFFGPTDLMQMYRRPWHPMIPYLLQTLTGTSPEQDPAIYNESSPAYFVTKDAPPTLILHGESDPIVDVAQSRLLSNKLKAAGVRHELVVYPRERHGWHGTTLTNSFDRIEKFLKSEHF
ncbi:MAG TPA: alpha/beta hydrolase, partial [Chitinophagaceae bacterium]|nr:alpha/beta hydrolase [Chitinophagaceae bacterium]